MITDKQIQSAIKSVVNRQRDEITLNDGQDGKGGGSLRLRIRQVDEDATAVWLAFWKRDGKRQTKQIGRYPSLSLADARTKFQADIRPLLFAGKMVRVNTNKVDNPTVEAMFKGYVEHMKAKGKASHVEVERVLLICKDCAADDLGRSRLAADIDADDVVEHVARYYQRGKKSAADKARSYIASAFSWAIQSARDYTNEGRRDWGVKTNPATDVPRDEQASNTRDRNLSTDEIKALWHGARADADNFTLETASCIRLLIACGQRVRETLRIDAEEIDLENKLWKMPAHKTKMGERPHTIPLPRQAVEVLRELIKAHPTGPLFPSRNKAKNPLIHDSSIMQAIERWYTDHKQEPLQTRDLRRTWKSRTADAGIDRFIRDVIQQHTNQDTGSKNYDRADYLPQMREAMTKWEKWLDKVCKVKAG
jgi:integrase